jgi:hypothetical protein
LVYFVVYLILFVAILYIYLNVIWYILWLFGIFIPFLVRFTKENLATLCRSLAWDKFPPPAIASLSTSPAWQLTGGNVASFLKLLNSTKGGFNACVYETIR